MVTLTETTITLNGRIDDWNADDWAARLRAVLRNGRPQIVLVVNPGTEITSASFLAFLASTRRYLDAHGGRLDIRGADGRAEHLMRLLGLPPG